MLTQPREITINLTANERRINSRVFLTHHNKEMYIRIKSKLLIETSTKAKLL